MKTLLTGARGNLGTYIQKNASFEIIPVGRQEWNNIDGIINDKIDTIIHCAYDLKNRIDERPDLVVDSNILTTTKLLNLSNINKIKNFIFISSCSVYGQSSNSKEEQACVPITINGMTKLLNEQIIESFCSKNNINYNILRVFNSYGGNDQFSVVQKMIDCAKKNLPFTLYNQGIAARDFIHIEDVAKIICEFTKIRSNHKIINLGTGLATPIKLVLSAIEKKFGKIQIDHKLSNSEVEYSRANTHKLQQIVPTDFQDIFHFIENLL